MKKAEYLMRLATPDVQYGAAAEADLARIVASTTTVDAQPPGQRPTWRRTLVPVVAVLVMVALVVGVATLRPTPAVAATPPMLVFTPMSTDAHNLLAQLGMTAMSQPDTSRQSVIVTQWWALASEVDENGVVLSSFVDPVRRVSQVGPEGLVSYTDFAGQPLDVHGRPVESSDGPPPGTELGATDVAADERFFPAAPPTAVDTFGTYLDGALPAGAAPRAAVTLQAIQTLLSERLLTPEQNAAMLEYLATLPDLILLGEGADRLGFAAYAFAAPVNPDLGTQSVLLIRTSTARVSAMETIYRGTHRTDIPSPAVLDYMLWEEP